MEKNTQIKKQVITAGTLWILRIIPAVLLLQSLYFKFTGSDESIYIFSIIGFEPYGRIGLGILELVTAVLILIPKTSWLGAFIGCGIMIAAILSHVFLLGIAVNNDQGLLFSLAITIFLFCLALVFINTDEYQNIKQKQH